MKLKTFITAAVIAGNTMTFSSVWAQQEPDPELLKAKEFLGTAGIPGDKWIEGETMDLLQFSGELIAHSRPAISNWTGL